MRQRSASERQENMKIFGKLTSVIIAALVAISAVPMVFAAESTPGYKLVNSYDEENGVITTELYLTDGIGGVGQLGVYYDNDLIALAAKSADGLTTEYDEAVKLSSFITSENGVNATAETNSTSKLINEDEGEFFFAWYAGGSSRVDATDGDVKLLTFSFLVNEGITAADLEDAGTELIMFATAIPSDTAVRGYDAGAFCSNENRKAFTNAENARYSLSTSVEFVGLDISEDDEAVSIKVVDAEGNPVEGAYVNIGTEEIRTDKDGIAKFSVTGTYAVSYKYSENDTYVALPGGETTAVVSVPAKMSAPTITTGTEMLTIKWQTPASGGSDITKYIISLTGTSTTTKEAVGDATSLEVKNLTGGRKYTVKIKAVNALGEGEFSDAAEGTPGTTGGGNTGGNIGGGTAVPVAAFTVTYDAGDFGSIQGTATTEKVSQNATPAKVPTVKANDGYEFIGWAVSGSTAIVNPTETKITKDTTFVAQYKEASATAWTNPYSDVKDSDWYYESVKTASELGLMNGVSETEFNPDGDVTRAMFVTVLYRMENQPEVSGSSKFSDVEAGGWYEKAVIWASENGIVNGITETEFSPNANITREQMAAMVYRYAKFKGQGFTGLWAFQLEFSDVASISDYAYEALCWCSMNGIINGMGDNTLAPQGNSTRAQAATVFIRALDSLAE